MGNPERADIEKALANWGKQRRESDAARDKLVNDALAAGISKHRVHVLTSIARTTIDRIVASRINEEGRNGTQGQ